LLHRRAESVDCIDLSPRVAEAGKQRLEKFDNVRFHQGDMHALPFDADAFDTVLLLHALTYSSEPERAAAEAARVLVRGGRLVCTTLNQHAHTIQVGAYGHVNNGFTTQDLAALFGGAGLGVEFCEVTSIEKKPPNFEIITLLATQP